MVRLCWQRRRSTAPKFFKGALTKKGGGGIGRAARFRNEPLVLDGMLFEKALRHAPFSSGAIRRATAQTVALLARASPIRRRSEEHTSELQSRGHLVCRLLLEKKKN